MPRQQPSLCFWSYSAELSGLVIVLVEDGVETGAYRENGFPTSRIIGGWAKTSPSKVCLPNIAHRKRTRRLPDLTLT